MNVSISRAKKHVLVCCTLPGGAVNVGVEEVGAGFAGAPTSTRGESF